MKQVPEEEAMPQSFTLRVPDSDIADLRERLARTRFPDSAPGDLGLTGRMSTIFAAWSIIGAASFDWRAQEARLNAFPQFKISRPDYDLHFLHVPGKGPIPTPLLLMHGWPGSCSNSWS